MSLIVTIIKSFQNGKQQKKQYQQKTRFFSNIYFISQPINKNIRMLNYKNSLIGSQKYDYNEDLPTAHKSNYIENSQSRLQNTPSRVKSHNKYDHRVEGVRNQINSMINDISGKKQMNNSAVEKIRNVNADALGVLQHAPTQPQKNYHHHRNNIHRLSHQEIINQNGDFYHANNEQYNQPQIRYDNYLNPQIEDNNIQIENLRLRKELNEQIRENNGLLRHIKYLENENDILRGQLGLPLSPKKYFNIPMGNHIRSNSNFQNSSYQNERANQDNVQTQNQNFYRPNRNVIPEDNRNSTRRQNVQHQYNNSNSRTAKFENPNSYESTSHRQGQLRNRSHIELLRQLQDLKDQDEMLRQKTLSILKNQQ